MSRTFTKLFSSITESTVWCEPDGTRLCWIAMLAMADRTGRVFASVPGLANRARVSMEDAQRAIATFLSPDTFSRTPDYEGRRIEPIDGGWRLLNHQKYRDLRDEDTRREQNREAQERFRGKQSASKPRVSQSKPRSANPSAHAEAEAEAEAEESKDIGGCAPSCGFKKFWDAYPRKIARAKAAAVWTKLAPEEQAAAFAAMPRHIGSEQWQREEGRYIPHPTTWLNQRRWEDQLPEPDTDEAMAERVWARIESNEGRAS